MNFLGTSLTFVLVYIWARRNPFIPMTFLGLFNFSAPFLPWVLLGFSLLLSNSVPYGDVLGIIVGHVYYFLEDVYPQTSGRRPLRTPAWFKRLVEGAGLAAPQHVQLEETSAWNEAPRPIENAQPPAEPLVPQAVQSSSAIRSSGDVEADSKTGRQVHQRHSDQIDARESFDKEDSEELMDTASSSNLDEAAWDHTSENAE